MHTTYDILIVGGGMVGASLAIALNGLGLRIGLIEAHPLGDPGQPGYDDRAIALSYGSQRIYQAIGLWPAIQPHSNPIETIHISDRGHIGNTRLTATQEQVPALGYVLPAKTLGKILLNRLADCSDVNIIAPAEVVTLDNQSEQAELAIRQNGTTHTLQAALLIAADGGHSYIRRTLQIPTTDQDYQQTAIVANITPGQPHANTAYQRFTDTGPVALLPLRAGHCTLIWTVNTEQQAEIMAYDEATFLAGFQARFGYRLGTFQRVSKRRSYPLSMMLAEQSIATRTAIIGNAAHTLHPIAGQGLNLGLRDIAALVEVIRETQDTSTDIGSNDTLHRYQQWRSTEQQQVAQATDGLVRLFTNPLRSVQWARNLGMLAFNQLPSAKHRLARAAMGISGTLPALARGIRPQDIMPAAQTIAEHQRASHAKCC